ncbi:hypothetical protein DEO72_LG2g4491 [Vigna unguiculata]|uniref:Uncharacterized protein n=1 Tax=Vigna unguiculata TaxID=3917 RepID=A0A4D6L6K8_VIGUN|nr:hypothetical protein DEO72_LG2g4491 [Vigna unguiculata]
MASLRFLFLAFLLVLSLHSIGEVEGSSRKLLSPSLPDLGNIPVFEFPPGTPWPEYRLPSFLKPNYPAIPSSYYFYTPPANTNMANKASSSKP